MVGVATGLALRGFTRAEEERAKRDLVKRGQDITKRGQDIGARTALEQLLFEREKLHETLRVEKLKIGAKALKTRQTQDAATMTTIFTTLKEQLAAGKTLEDPKVRDLLAGAENILLGAGNIEGNGQWVANQREALSAIKRSVTLEEKATAEGRSKVVEATAITGTAPQGPALLKLAGILDSPSPLEEKIDLIRGAFNTDQKTSVGLATGALRVVTDPVRGGSMIVDMSTGMAKPIRLASTTAVDDATTEGGEEPEGIEAETLWDLSHEGIGVTGIAPGLGELYSKTFGQLPVFPVPESLLERRTFFGVAQQDLARSLVINPKFPVAEVTRIMEQTEFDPSVFDSNRALQARMTATDKFIRGRVKDFIADAANENLPPDTRQAQASNAAAMERFLRIMGVPQGDNPPSDLTPEDDALIQKYLKPAR